MTIMTILGTLGLSLPWLALLWPHGDRVRRIKIGRIIDVEFDPAP